ncbi:hypothetical protein J7384_17655 [Endozoicomonas sp. G2_1]|uniref:hypothetical protein n=1 Tax=Endozoicomonas sp. G2_1 TaxID=2821091 RepID=UPI001ADA90A3|nr:hypothetical protein [Endozoicomonas sp. G2_1]MBO9492191.1 hypothetical protein [Endozoicomonas sp. G2_1]
MKPDTQVPKKKEANHHSKAACKSIKGQLKGKELFRLVYGREGSDDEVQGLLNRLNHKRANPGVDFVGELVVKLPHLHDMTLAEFFGIEQ